MNTNDNFDTLWSNLKDRVKEARTAQKLGVHACAEPNVWAYWVSLRDSLNDDNLQTLFVSHPYGSANINLDAKGCLGLAAQLIACADKINTANASKVSEAHSHLLTGFDQRA